MAILLNNNGYDNHSWEEALSELLPDQPVFIYPNIPDPKQIEYALVWDHPHNDLLNYPNLRAVLVLGAGTEHVDSDPSLPKVPIVRLIDPAVVNDMALYVLYWVMHFHRRYEDYRRQTQKKQWLELDVCAPEDCQVSVLGLGEIGASVATRLALNGYKTQGWSRTQKQLEGVSCHSGEHALEQVLSQTHILVNCLPLTTDTQQLLNRQRLQQLPRGAYLINPGRGATIDDKALLTLLDSKHIACAALDTFTKEPLPEDSPYWSHDNVFVTPHIAGTTYARSAAKVVASNIKKITTGEQPFPLHIPPQHKQVG